MNVKKLVKKGVFREMKENLELKHYMKMIENYQGDLKTRKKIESIGFNTITRLMLYLKLTGNKQLIQNLIIILLALYMDVPPDNFNNVGLPLNQLSSQDKRMLYSKLKQELTVN